MATYDLEEQEQIAEIKAWWKQYGNLMVGIVTAVSVGVIAWQGWNWYQRGQAAKASMVYGALQKAVVEDDAQRVGHVRRPFALASVVLSGPKRRRRT